jgi:hypothetical protein
VIVPVLEDAELVGSHASSVGEGGSEYGSLAVADAAPELLRQQLRGSLQCQKLLGHWKGS